MPIRVLTVGFFRIGASLRSSKLAVCTATPIRVVTERFIRGGVVKFCLRSVPFSLGHQAKLRGTLHFDGSDGQKSRCADAAKIDQYVLQESTSDPCSKCVLRIMPYILVSFMLVKWRHRRREFLKMQGFLGVAASKKVLTVGFLRGGAPLCRLTGHL